MIRILPSCLLAVALLSVGCRDAAPAAETPLLPEPPPVSELANAQDSVYALANAILDNLRTGDYDELRQLALDGGEFRYLVWEKLPASEPERNLTWDYVWADLDQKSGNALRMTIDRHRGRNYRLMRVEFADETTDYETYKVHRDARCVVEDEDGVIRTLDLFGSVIEMDGRYKAFSYVVD